MRVVRMECFYYWIRYYWIFAIDTLYFWDFKLPIVLSTVFRVAASGENQQRTGIHDMCSSTNALWPMTPLAFSPETHDSFGGRSSSASTVSYADAGPRQQHQQLAAFLQSLLAGNSTLKFGGGGEHRQINADRVDLSGDTRIFAFGGEPIGDYLKFEGAKKKYWFQIYESITTILPYHH